MSSVTTSTETPRRTAAGREAPVIDVEPGADRRRRWRFLRRGDREREPTPEARTTTRHVEPVELPANDPLLVYLTSVRRPVDVDELELGSPGVQALRAAGVRMLVPLVASGELIGVIQLGERLSEQEYSADDRRLLEMLASQAAPALRVGQLVEEQREETRVRERYEQELQVARLIQQRFLPNELPEPAGWRIHPFYRAAREVGGDFYDVLDLPDGQLGLVIGDVTDKGVPAALVMASARSVLRAAAQRLVEPGAVLARVNDELVVDVPSKMFVTCLYGVLDPRTGDFRFANAGHDLPVLHQGEHAREIKATGMPLGLLPGAEYDEVSFRFAPGDRLLLYSDGLAEAHAPDGRMFGFPRVCDTVRDLPDGPHVIDDLLAVLDDWVGPDWDQEDDITLVMIKRSADEHSAGQHTPRFLTAFSLPSEPDGEREAIRRVTAAVADLGLSDDRLEALQTAVGEAVMNAMEHGNRYDPDLPVEVEVVADDATVSVSVTDHGGSDDVLDAADTPDIDAKLRGEQSPRGWGLFLVRSLVDEVHESGGGDRHVLTLEMHIGGGA